ALLPTRRAEGCPTSPIAVRVASRPMSVGIVPELPRRPPRVCLPPSLEAARRSKAGASAGREPIPSALATVMTAFRQFLRSGHGPTLFAAFLYFMFSCLVWVLNGAMAPFISETFGLDAAHKGLMLSVPIVAGALMRFPLGVLSQYIGRKNATLVEMGII